MTISPDVLRAVAHGILDVTAVSVVLTVVAFAVARIPGVDAGTRSRWWSAAAIVPLLAFAAALAQPLFMPAQPAAATAYAGGAGMLHRPHGHAAARDGNGRACRARTGARTWADFRRDGIASRERFVARHGARALVRLRCLPRHSRVRLRGARASARGRRVARFSTCAAGRCGCVARRASLARRRPHADRDRTHATGRSSSPRGSSRRLPHAELRAVVLHEIAHLRRRDDWTYLLERLACAVLWVESDLIALAARSAAPWREIACDASAAREIGGRICASALWRSASVLAPAGGERTALALLSGATLVERVEALLHPAAASARRTLAATVALAVLACTAGALIALRAPAYALPGARGLTPTGSMHTRRASFAFVKLRDGRVLVAGGMIANHNFTSAAELYDPARGVFEPTGSLLGRTHRFHRNAAARRSRARRRWLDDARRHRDHGDLRSRRRSVRRRRADARGTRRSDRHCARRRNRAHHRRIPRYRHRVDQRRAVRSAPQHLRDGRTVARTARHAHRDAAHRRARADRRRAQRHERAPLERALRARDPPLHRRTGDARGALQTRCDAARRRVGPDHRRIGRQRLGRAPRTRPSVTTRGRTASSRPLR